MLKTDTAKEKAQHIVTLFNDPDLLESFSKSNKKTEFSKQLTLISMEREARKNPKKSDRNIA